MELVQAAKQVPLEPELEASQGPKAKAESAKQARLHLKYRLLGSE